MYCYAAYPPLALRSCRERSRVNESRARREWSCQARRFASQIAYAMLFDGVLVDVEDFAAAHPGGADVFEEGRDLLEDFLAVGHSASAKKKLLHLARGAEGLEGLERALFASAPRSKLFTDEDASNTHKALGALHLVYFYLVRPLRLQALPPWLWCAALSLLSLSSLKFHVPLQNPRGVPTISALFRMHSIVFALRGAACAAANELLSRPLPARVLVVAASAAIADVASFLAAWRSGAGSWTTTRSMPYGESIGERQRRAHRLGYAYAQFGALAMCLHDPEYPLRPLDTLAAIQGAAFLQTLVRKGLLAAWGYHALYSLQLLYVALLGLSLGAPALSSSALSAAAFALRLAGCSKYLVLLFAISWAACYEAMA